MINLQKGAIYQHANFGPLEYLRVDEFYGQRTLEFRQISNGKSRYLLPEAVEKMLATVENIETVKQQRDNLTLEVERLRMQLAACGVVAMSNTPESAALNRDMHQDYMSASCQEVIRAVDREMALRAERDDLQVVINDHQRLVRELDVILNGEDGAARQASLCDIVSQLDKSGGAA